MPPEYRAGDELSDAEFGEVIRLAPLISIDLIVSEDAGKVLLGVRRNRPAAGSWFVPGGRIRKGETISAALRRLAETELGAAMDPARWRFSGVAEHLYGEDYLGRQGGSTHYVVLAHSTRVRAASLRLPMDQHTEFRWWDIPDVLQSAGVHPNTRAYFEPGWAERWDSAYG
jgi:colanic acid biosynthesis protein WcaH